MIFSHMLFQLIEGFLVTVEIFSLTLIFSLPLGLLVALARMSRFFLLSNFMKLYISIMRGTPLMLQLLVCYFGPWYLFKISLASHYRFTAVIIAFSLNYAAYFAEIFRGGIESMPVGQYEAARVLGYSRIQTFFRIIMPQVIKRIIPAITNEVITLVKDTSLAFSLSVLEMFTIAKQISSAHTTMVPFIVTGVFYYVFNALMAFAMGRIEKHLGYYR